MKTLEKNTLNLYGESGKKWLESLPSIVKNLSLLWDLDNIKPVENMSWNYVALAMQSNHRPVVLKISPEHKLIQDEYKTLKYFDGNGAIQVIDVNLDQHALLLEQAIPGYLLKENHPNKIEDTISIYGNVVKKLSTHNLTEKNFTHISEWCNAIDRITDQRINKNFIDKAKLLRSQLLNNPQCEYLCHGDLHLENIIQLGSDWVCIDPKGIIGEMAFEASAFDLLSKEEMNVDSSLISHMLVKRIELLSQSLEILFDRLLAWIFLRIIISAQWFIEDNGDPSQMLTLANFVYPLLAR